jgi:N-acetylglutamate synthase
MTSDNDSKALIQELEIRSMRAWPALTTRYYDGWVLRFAHGYTGRANSIHPIYSGELDLETRIICCETVYRRQNQQTLFKLTPASFPTDLDAALGARGYSLPYEVSVLTADLSQMQTASSSQVKTSSRVNDLWLWHYFRMSGTDRRHRDTLVQMLGLLTPTACYAVLEKGDDIVALGIGVYEAGMLGLFKIETDPRYRRQGFGTALVSTLLDWGKSQGATLAYLQTEPENEPALRLYDKLGFQELYRYWYRTQPEA